MLRKLLARISGTFAGGEADAEAREEFESHLAHHVAENVRRGMHPDDARRHALMASGGLATATEAVREQRGLPFIETLIADTRYGVRTLKRNPAFTVVAIATLALGIGANTAIFSVVNNIVLRPLPYVNSEDLVTLRSNRGERLMSVSVPDFMDWRASARSFSGLVAGFRSTTTLTGIGEPVRLSQSRVSANVFDVFGIRPVRGRAFLPGEDERPASRVALLSEGVWKSRFGSDTTIIGRTLQFDGLPVTIIGIAPSSLQWPAPADVWMTTRFSDRDLQAPSRGARWLNVIGRVKRGTSLGAARAEMAAIASRLEELDAEHNKNIGTHITPLLESMVGNFQRPLFVLLGAVGFVLLIACANVGSLTLARVATRDSELAVRTALGAGRTRIARQILTESLLVAFAGGLMGVLLAVAGIRALIAIAPAGIPRLDEVGLDIRVLAFTFAVTVLAGILFGLVPALHGSALNLHGRLRDSGRSVSGGKANARSRRTLVVAEMALAIVLLAGAGLLLRSFALLRSVDPGFQSRNVSTFSLATPASTKYAEASQLNEFTSALLNGLARIPGVQAVAASFSLPLSGDSFSFTFDVHGRPPVRENEPTAQARVITDDYFRAMEIPLLKGRTFDATDNATGRQTLVISSEVARLYFPNEDPIGKYLETGWGQRGKRFGGEVIGVVGDVRQFALDKQPTPHLYMRYAQFPLDEYDVVVRGTSPPATVFNGARAVLKELDDQIPINGARPLSDIVDSSLGQQRFYLTLLASFAGVAMLLALVGIYGIVAYSVQQRRREIGIRLALGASRQGVVSMVLFDGLRLVGSGVALGLFGTLLLTRLLEALLFQVGTHDPLTLVAAPALLTIAAAFACLVPARIAARQNPVEVIRSD